MLAARLAWGRVFNMARNGWGEAIAEGIVWSVFFIATNTLAAPLFSGIEDVLAGKKVG